MLRELLVFIVFNATYFDYVNNAARGIFIAPSYNISDISKILKNGYLQKFIDGGHNAAWVAMRNDGGEQLIGVIPWAEIATSKVAIFRRKEHPFRAVLLRNTKVLFSSGTDAALTHNIQYKGVYNVKGSSGTKMQALCRKGPGDFQRTRDSFLLEEAPQKCKNISSGDEYRFLPPLSSLEWVKAMTLLNKHDEAYPFPKPGNLLKDKDKDEDYIQSISVDAPSVWVALSNKTTGSGSSTEAWRLSDVYFPDTPTVKSIFRHTEENIPKKGFDAQAKTKYIGIIDAQGRPVVPTNLSINVFLNSDLLKSPYKVACYIESGSGDEQVTLKSSVTATSAATGSCPNGQEEVGKDFLNEKRKSIKFMSEWVKENESGHFVISREAIDEMKTRAENLYCKKSVCPDCKNECEAKKDSCKRDCPYRCSKTVPGPDVPDPVCVAGCGTDAACVSACGTVPGPDITKPAQCQTCFKSCDDGKVQCKNKCYKCGGNVKSDCNEQCDCEFKFENWTQVVLPDNAPLL